MAMAKVMRVIEIICFNILYPLCLYTWFVACSRCRVVCSVVAYRCLYVSQLATFVSSCPRRLPPCWLTAVVQSWVGATIEGVRRGNVAGRPLNVHKSM